MQKKPTYANIPKKSLIQRNNDGLFYDDESDYLPHMKQESND